LGKKSWLLLLLVRHSSLLYRRRSSISGVWRTADDVRKSWIPEHLISNSKMTVRIWNDFPECSTSNNDKATGGCVGRWSENEIQQSEGFTLNCETSKNEGRWDDHDDTLKSHWRVFLRDTAVMLSIFYQSGWYEHRFFSPSESWWSELMSRMNLPEIFSKQN
jgi:hypothetical protein